MAFPFTAVLDAVFRVVDKVLPDPKAKAEMQLKIMELQQSGEFKQLEAELQMGLGQLEVNKIEASAGTFRGGWRPAIGWVCAAAFGYQFIARPVMIWLGPSIGIPVGAPALDMGDLMTVMLGMLGLGGLRTAEKMKGIG